MSCYCLIQWHTEYNIDDMSCRAIIVSCKTYSHGKYMLVICKPLICDIIMLYLDIHAILPL